MATPPLKGGLPTFILCNVTTMRLARRPRRRVPSYETCDDDCGKQR